LFEDYVCDFSLVIGLWMVGRTQAKLSATHAEQFSPECTDKNGVVIGYQALGKPMELTNYV